MSTTKTSLYYYRARYYDPQAGRFISEDPLSFELGATNFYSYASNAPLNYADPLGLSPGDVQRILNQAQNIIDQMTQNGDRINNGKLNNIISSLQRLNPKRKKPPLKGCGEQADKVASDLQFPSKPYDDHWTFSVVTVKSGLIPIFFHQIAVAHSDNPNDPDIIIDPWNNTMFTNPQVKLPLGGSSRTGSASSCSCQK